MIGIMLKQTLPCTCIILNIKNPTSMSRWLELITSFKMATERLSLRLHLIPSMSRDA